MSRSAVVAVDVGGTSLKGALVASDGAVLARRAVATPAAAGGAAVTAAVLNLVRDLAAGATLVDASVVGVAAVTPGQVADGVIRYAANLGWRDVPLADLLTDALGVPAAVDNDVWAAALAEARLGGRGSDCLFVALGTGIGGAHVRDGSVAAGATGAAGEIGHIPVYPDGERCGCGQLGCLEVYASAAGIARRYCSAAGIARRYGVAGVAADDIVARLGSDAAADRVWAEAVEALAIALATATLLLDPGVIVLGGGLAGAGGSLVGPLTERLVARLAWRSPPPVVVSDLAADAGWRGASLRAWAVSRQLGSSDRVGVAL